MARNSGQLRLTKLEKNLKYVWEQIENWLEYRFKMPILVEVYDKTGLVRQFHHYSISRINPKGVFEVFIEAKVLREGKKDELLNVIGREACRIYLMAKNRRMITETDPEFKELVISFELPWYGTMPEEGMDMYEYRCLGCNEIITATPKKIPKSKAITYNPKKVTECCGAMIKESDEKHHYTNEELQKIQHLISG